MKRMIYWGFIVAIVAYGGEPILPLPQQVHYDRAKALLGKRLFEDRALSKDHSVACVSCHSYTAGGADPRPVSVGVNGKSGSVQSPTVYNARYNFKQFWNGRAETLTDQANGPIHNPLEMGMDEQTIERRLNADSSYQKAFARVYGSNRIRYAQVIDAIVAFEKTLVTPNSRFDRFLRGEKTLSKQEMHGYLRFKEFGCITCHNGINIGGNSFQKMGLFIPYKHQVSTPDRYKITKRPIHENVFKVPTLRNISLTAPYFHDASASTLKEAVQKMSYHNLGIRLSKDDVDAIVAFLKTLTGDRPELLR